MKEKSTTDDKTIFPKYMTKIYNTP